MIPAPNLSRRIFDIFRKPNVTETAVLCVLILLNCWVLSYTSFRIFKFFDMGWVIDYAWRIHQGQRPNIDFFTHVGPIHPGILALCFKVFGFGKMAIYTFTAVSHALAILATYALLRRRVPGWALWSCVLLTMTGFYWWLSFPWYTQTAHLWCLLALTVIVRTLPFSNTRTALQVSAITGMLLVISFLTKPNIGLVYGCVFAVTFLISSKRFGSLTGLTVGVVLMAAIASWIILPDPWLFLSQTVFQYGANQKWRMLRMVREPALYLLNYYWIVLVVVWSNILLQGLRRPLGLIALFHGIYLIAIFDTASSGAIFQCNTPLMGTLIGLGFLILGSNQNISKGDSSWIQSPGAWVWRIGEGILMVLSASLIVLYAHYGIQTYGWLLPDHVNNHAVRVDPRGNYRLKTAPLRDWLTTEDQGRAVDEITIFIREQIPTDQPIMVLSDIFVLDAVTGRVPSKGVYVPFTIDLMPLPGAPTEAFKRSFVESPPDWIVTHNGPVAFIGGLLKYLNIGGEMRDNYSVVFKSGVYLVLRRTGPAPLKIQGPAWP